jgi:hypothetical protein
LLDLCRAFPMIVSQALRHTESAMGCATGNTVRSAANIVHVLKRRTLMPAATGAARMQGQAVARKKVCCIGSSAAKLRIHNKVEA